MPDFALQTVTEGYLAINVVHQAEPNSAFAYYGGSAFVRAYNISYDMQNAGITVSHEVGHVLNLYHTFEGYYQDNCPANQFPERQGDAVADTDPHHPSDPTNCGLEESEQYINRCTGQPFGKIHRNIMSYGCYRNLFTAGQVRRMRTHLATQYNPLVTSTLADPTDPNDAPMASVCQPTYTLNSSGGVSNKGILGVQLANLNRGSTVPPSFRYDDQSCTQMVRLTKGQTYSLVVSGSGTYGRVYVDYNNDGNFSENDELLTVFVSPNDGGIQTHVKPVDIPVSALTNQRLRMRVIFDSGSTPPTACNLPGHPVVGSGEVEDYSVIVVDPTCHTLKDGFWTDPTIWSCGRVPDVMDVVHVNHEVTVPENYLAMAARLVYAQTVSGIRLSTGASIQLAH